MSAQHALTPPPPPPPGAVAAVPDPTPRRRQYAVQPPTLTTALNATHNHGLGLGLNTQTPISTTSLSSPFSQYNPSTFTDSAGGAARGTSPMASRNAASFNAPYNPQQWGAVAASLPNIGMGQAFHARHRTQLSRAVAVGPEGSGSDVPAASPPPPYSPRRAQQSHVYGASNSTTISPADTVSPGFNPSQYNTPTSAATTVSPDTPSGNRTGRFPRPLSLVHSNISPNPAFTTTFPPPPPPKGQGSRSSSRDPTHKPAGLFSLSSLASRARATPNSPVPTAIDVQQHYTVAALARAHPNPVDDSAARAPASRRAASTGGIGLSGPSSRASRQESTSPSQDGWEPGMPLPPPPPGLPPSARSQSMSRSSEGSAPGRSFTTPVPTPLTRRPPGLGTSLGPVPPTPADWVEEEVSQQQDALPSRVGRQLHIDTRNVPSNLDAITSLDTDPTVPSLHDSVNGRQSRHTRQASNNAQLFRSPAVRNSSAKGIRERRSESRNGREGRLGDQSAVSISGNPWQEAMDGIKPSDLVLPKSGTNLSGRRTVTKSTPRSGRSLQSPEPAALSSAPSTLSSGAALSLVSSNGTAHPDSSHSGTHPERSTPTPPFSPGAKSFSHVSPDETASPLPPKSLPTPPPQHYGEYLDASSRHAPPGNQARPISHILHVPNPNNSIQPPLTPSRPSSRQSVDQSRSFESAEAFKQRATERHGAFVEKEAASRSDRENLEDFVRFVVTETKVRRGRYAKVFEDMSPATSIFFEDILRFQFDGEPSGAAVGLQPERLSHPRRGEPQSRLSLSGGTQGRPESAWWNGYVPALSPIASMSIDTGLDEMESRGRAQSRWWESNSSGSMHDGVSRGMERTKRESKYMGVSRSSLDLPQPGLPESNSSSSNLSRVTAGPSGRRNYGPNEYPPEKVGWYDPESPLPPPPFGPPTPKSASFTPDPRKLDVSRLVTLPPPYPRHHPAVNNSHPELASIRAIVRFLSDLTGVINIKEQNASENSILREEAQQKASSRRSGLRAQIRDRIDAGTMSYAEAAEAESKLDEEESQKEKQRKQVEFDKYQTSVVSPLHTRFSEQIAKATASFDQLSSRLFNDAQERSPNLTQEEGDEQPELLEKLTQLKWLFETREQLHREIYDLLSERNDKYRAIVVLPYQQARNDAKLAEAEAFFAKDALDRKLSFERETLQRFEAFNDVVESNVVRGVEVQLSAFWDIAPALLQVLQKIPADLRGFDVQIPPDEFADNPGYADHPLQYLYSLLSHARKSTYQFIESQTNLLCLLHEVKSGVMNAGCSVLRTQRIVAGEGLDVVERDVREVRVEEGERLTRDLKEKVGTLEGLWGEGLGEEMDGVKGRVREWLVERGGWDDEEE